jgi:phenylalanyl-tRNA synthetase beta chain
MRVSLKWLRELIELPEQISAAEIAHALTMGGLEVESITDVDFSKDLGLPPAEEWVDTVFDIGVTPNRSDALCHMGIAREIAALLQLRTRFPIAICKEQGGPIHEAVQVSVPAREACRRYAVRVIEEVHVQESPDALKVRLLACGMRPVNNIVDITNWVMLERGLPLHAFDYDALYRERGRVPLVVRFANANEKITTLDGVDRLLSPEDLVIGDGRSAAALAGLMGSRDTEVTKQTTTVLLEGANFDAGVIRRMAKRHGLATEASHRFERGCDPNAVTSALDRAADLMTRMANARVRRDIVDIYPKRVEPVEISVRAKRLQELSGLPKEELDEVRIRQLFLQLGIETVGKAGDMLCFRAPTFRPDLTREIDLIEEALRLIGYDKVPSRGTFRRRVGEPLVNTQLHVTKARLREVLYANGFFEAVNYSLGSKELFSRVEKEDTEFLSLSNPLGEEFAFLRRNLLPQLLVNASSNLKHGTKDIRLFEMGTVFLGKNAQGAAPRKQHLSESMDIDSYAIERLDLTGVVLGQTGPQAFDVKQSSADFFELKGVIEDLVWRVLIKGQSSDKLRFVSGDLSLPFLHPGKSARIELQIDEDATALNVGYVGTLHPDLVDRFEFESEVYVFSLDVKRLASRCVVVPKASPLMKHPGVKRDLALLVDEVVPAGAIVDLVRAQGSFKDILEDVQIFDLFRGGSVPLGKKSLALRIFLRSKERTLRDEEVAEGIEQLINAFQSKLDAAVR